MTRTVTTTTTTSIINYSPAKVGENKATRHMKIGYLNRPGAGGKYQDVPFIRMSGNWLAEAGFDIDDQVEVTVQENQLVITKLVEEDTSTVS